MNKTVKIACACNKKFAVLLATLLKSIEVNHCINGNTVEVFIIDNGIGVKRKNKIIDTVDQQKVSLRFLKIPLHLKNTLNAFPNGSKFTHYYRLFLVSILPETIERILYLDCDMLVLNSLTSLWEIQLNPNEIIGAVEDTPTKTVNSKVYHNVSVISNWQQLGFDMNDPYFNSGLLLIDLYKWRENNITQKVIDITAQYFEHVFHYDQYGLNVILRNKWKLLNSSYNSFCIQKELDLNDIVILHFISIKPNAFDYPNGYQVLFYHYLDQTKWSKKRGLEYKKIPKLFDRVLKKHPILQNFGDNFLYKINQFIQPW